MINDTTISYIKLIIVIAATITLMTDNITGRLPRTYFKRNSLISKNSIIINSFQIIEVPR